MSDLIDALPYIDNEFNNPEIRSVVAEMIENETKRYKPTKNYLETLPQLPPLDLTKFEVKLNFFLFQLFEKIFSFFFLL